MAASGIDELFNEWYSRFNSGTYVIPHNSDNIDSNNTLIVPDEPKESNNTDLNHLTIAQLQSIQFSQQITHE